MILDKSRSAVSKLAALADVRPDLAPIVRAAAAVCESVIDDAAAQIAVAKAETLAEIEKVAEFGAAITQTVAERDEAEIAKSNLELENSALRIKDLQIERQQQVKRQYIAKAETEAIEKAEDASIAAEVASTVAVLAYLWKSVRHGVTGKSFIDAAKKSPGPWDCLQRDGSVIVAQTKQEAVDVAMRLERESREKSALDAKKPRKYPDLGAETSEDTFDSKQKSERVPITKSRVSGKRRPKWSR
jgi:hypothetical protein